MDTANQILESLDAAEIRQRIEAIEKEKQALLILHRAAIRLDRPDKSVRNQQADGRGAGQKGE